MVKNIIAVVFVFTLTLESAFASHFFQCTFEAKVTDVRPLARLNDSVVISGMDPKLDDSERLADLTVSKILDPGHRGCKAVGDTTTLYVKESLQSTYKRGQTLKIFYQNVGDARASRITWEVQEIISEEN